MSPLFSTSPEKRKRFLAASCALGLVVLVALGVFAKNGWLPSTDPLTGKKTSWFGRTLSQNASDVLGPSVAAPPNPTPRYTKDYVYAGDRLVSVVDANAQEAPPTDLAVWRPSTGTWWVMGGQGSQQVSQAWGLNGDKPVPGDYDGDGKTDFSVFRPGSTINDPGTWYVLRSIDNAWEPLVVWGLGSDRLVPADYDGDGKTDRAIWRPSDGTWYIVKSSTGSSQYSLYGNNGDLPIPADYDGDGLADLAVWRDSNKTFYSINTSNGAAQTVLTSPTIGSGSYDWHAASGDHDGDGRAEYALYNKNTATWFIRNSATGLITTTTWGNGGDIPVHNDYDGDGKVDIAVWRSDGHWYILKSSNGSAREEIWGTSGDIPVPAFYRR